MGGKLFFCGNGGSAAESTHIAAEFVGKCLIDVGAQPAISLNDSISALTGVSNDWGFEQVFSRQLQALGKPGDLIIALSTSGKSKNILKVLETGRRLSLTTSLWTSAVFEDSIDVDYLLKIPSRVTPRIQEVHLQLGHVMSELVASKLES
jgi:D-sedoheptulose 7-phosphate isomerase